MRQRTLRRHRVDGRRGGDRGPPHPARPMRHRRRHSLLYVIYLRSRCGDFAGGCGSSEPAAAANAVTHAAGSPSTTAPTVGSDTSAAPTSPSSAGTAIAANTARTRRPAGAAASLLGSTHEPGHGNTTCRGPAEAHPATSALLALIALRCWSSPPRCSGSDELVADPVSFRCRRLRGGPVGCSESRLCAGGGQARFKVASLPSPRPAASVPLGRPAGAAGPRSTNRSPKEGTHERRVCYLEFVLGGAAGRCGPSWSRRFSRSRLGGASAVDGQELRPVLEVGLVREDRLSFSVVFDHDDWLSRADRVTAVEAGGV